MKAARYTPRQRFFPRCRLCSVKTDSPENSAPRHHNHHHHHHCHRHHRRGTREVVRAPQAERHVRTLHRTSLHFTASCRRPHRLELDLRVYIYQSTRDPEHWRGKTGNSAPASQPEYRRQVLSQILPFPQALSALHYGSQTPRCIAFIGNTLTTCKVRLYFNTFSTGTHFYLEIFVHLDHFIDIRKGLWRAED
ncbi:hypothetical protein E2C01_060734 [Portunus trituberculatus]|uniref:Uncharacterized protein n=1 Tax=Portunus trituberculatus TaxID=210409 RepID=A0A5B7HAA3_PORTR|nr:hypothetical protein [Portunus trituberculatus]